MTTTTGRTSRTNGDNASTMVGRGVAGVVGGLAGGLVFGVMMHAMGMMPMIAAMVGAESVLNGWIIHLAISSFIGVSYALVFAPTRSMGGALVTGMGWGLLWWVLGPLLIMPTALGMGLFMINQTTVMSLVGHLVFGAILGLVAMWWTSRALQGQSSGN